MSKPSTRKPFTPKVNFKYTRHLNSVLTDQKTEFYRTHPQYAKKRYSRLNISQFKSIINGAIDEVLIFPHLRDLISSSVIPTCIGPSTWIECLRTVANSLSWQAEALFSQVHIPINNPYDPLVMSLRDVISVREAFHLKGKVVAIHAELGEISVKNEYPATMTTLPGVLVHTDMISVASLGNEGAIVPYTYLLAALDQAESLFSYQLYIHLLSTLPKYRGLPIVAMYNEVYEFLDAVYLEHGNAAVDFFKLLEPLSVGSVLTNLDPDTNFVEFLDELRRDLVGDKRWLLAPFNILSVKYLGWVQDYGALSYDIILDMYGQEKMHNYPIIDIEKGALKMFQHGTHPTMVNQNACLELKGSFIREYIYSYRLKEGHMPSICPSSKLTPALSSVLTKDKIESFSHFLKIPETDWAEINFLPHKEFQYYPDAMDLLDDKAISPHMEHWQQLFALDALDFHNIPHVVDKETTRLVEELLNREEIDIREFYRICEEAGHIPNNWALIQLLPKEQELKISARLFSILTFEVRMMCSALEKNIASSILKYFPQQTMCDSGSDLRSRVDKISLLKSSPEFVWLCMVMDLEQWNYTFRIDLEAIFSIVLDQIFGVSHFSIIRRVFLDSFLCAINKFQIPGHDLSFLSWTNHLGGNQGIFQKFWTLITIIIIKRVMNKADLPHILIGSGDNQVLTVRFPRGPIMRNVIEQLRTGLSHAFTEVGLTLKETETWFSEDLICYQRKYHFSGAPVLNGVKQANKAAAGGADYNCGINMLISQAMNSGVNISENTYDTTLGPVFAYLEAYVHIYLTPTYLPLTSYGPEVAALLAFFNTSFGFLPFIQLPGFLYSGRKDVLTESLALVSNLWYRIPRLQPYIRRFLSWERGSDGDEDRVRCLEDPQSINIRKPPSVEIHLKRAVEEYLHTPGVVKNKTVLELLKSSTELNITEFLVDLLKIRPVNTSLCRAILSISHHGQVATVINRFNKVSSILGMVERQLPESTIANYQVLVKSIDNRIISHIVTRWGRQSDPDRVFIKSLLGGLVTSYDRFCQTHELDPLCVFSSTLFLRSWTNYLYPEYVSGPFLPAPWEQIQITGTCTDEDLTHAIVITPAHSIPHTTEALQCMRGPFSLLIGSSTDTNVRIVRLFGLQGYEAGKVIHETLRLMAWITYLKPDSRILAALLEHLRLRSPAVADIVPRLLHGVAGGTFTHRFSVPGDVMGSYLNSLSLSSSWYQFSTNEASILKRGSEDRYIFYQELYQYIGAYLRFVNPIHSRLFAIINMTHCSYLVPESRFDTTEDLTVLNQLSVPLAPMSARAEAAIRREAQHLTLIQSISSHCHFTGAELLVAYIAHQFTSQLARYQHGMGIEDYNTSAGRAPQSTYNVSILKVVSCHRLLSAIFLSLMYHGTLTGSNSKLKLIAKLHASVGTECTIQDLRPYSALIEAMITSGHLPSLCRIANTTPQWEEGNYHLYLGHLFIKALLHVGSSIHNSHHRLPLLVVAKSKMFSWSGLWVLLGRFSPEFRAWVKSRDKSTPDTILYKYFTFNYLIAPLVTTDPEIVLTRGRKLIERNPHFPNLDVDTVTSSSCVLLPGPPERSCIMIQGLELGTVSPPTLEIVENYLSSLDKRLTICKFAHYVGRWNSRASSAKNKYLELLCIVGFKTDKLVNCISLAEGAGSVFSMLLHLNPACVGYYNSLLPQESLPHSMSTNFVPPEVLCPCNASSRMINPHSVGPTHGDLAREETWLHIMATVSQLGLQPSLMTWDMECSGDHYITCLNHLRTHLIRLAPQMIIIKLFIDRVIKESPTILHDLSTKYTTASLIKPHYSDILSTECFLVCSGWRVDNSCHHQFNLNSFLVSWTQAISLLSIGSYMREQVLLAQWWPCELECLTHYPSTGSLSPPAEHSFCVSVKGLLSTLIEFVIAPSIQSNPLDPLSRHMTTGKSKGHEAFYDHMNAMLLCVSWYLQAVRPHVEGGNAESLSASSPDITNLVLEDLYHCLSTVTSPLLQRQVALMVGEWLSLPTLPSCQYISTLTNVVIDIMLILKVRVISDIKIPSNLTTFRAMSEPYKWSPTSLVQLICRDHSVFSVWVRALDWLQTKLSQDQFALRCGSLYETIWLTVWTHSDILGPGNDVELVLPTSVYSTVLNHLPKKGQVLLVLRPMIPSIRVKTHRCCLTLPLGDTHLGIGLSLWMTAADYKSAIA